MADNNPYSKKAVSEQLPILSGADLFCVSHSGFASDYPFNYGYSIEECMDKYLKLEMSRQKSN